MTGPFSATWRAYRQAGWNVLPIIPGKKHTPLEGVTGRFDNDLSDDECEKLADGKFGDYGIGLRMPYGVIGIDVDAYAGKSGGETLLRLEIECGPLPKTWKSSARGDGESGIRFFRVPSGFVAVGDLGEESGIEVVQRRHRLAVVWPSINPKTLTTYRWYSPDGEVVNQIPKVEELPWLP